MRYLYIGIVSLIFMFVLFTFILTMLPGQAFHDAGEFQTVIYTLQIPHPTGFPLYVMLGKLFSSVLFWIEPAWVANFSSVIYSVGALLFLGMIIARISRYVDHGHSVLSLLAIPVYAFIESYWYYSGIADPHTLNRLFFFALIYVFMRYTEGMNKQWLYGWLFVLGCALSNHLLIIYSVPGFLCWYCVVLWSKRNTYSFFNDFKLQSLFLCAVLVTVPLLSYLILPIVGYEGLVHNANYSLRTWSGFYRHVSGQSFHGLMFSDGLWASFSTMIDGLLELPNFITTTGVGLALCGFVFALYQRSVVPFSIGMLMMFFSLAFFSYNYPTSDPKRYYLLHIGILVIFLGYCLSLLEVWIRSLLAKHATVIVGIAFLILSLIPITLYADNFDRVDKSQNTDAGEFAERVFSELEQDSVVVVWWHYYTPLWYRQYVLNQRSDILIENNSMWLSTVEKWYGKKTVYLIEYNEEVAQYYSLLPQGNIWKVETRYSSQ